MIIVLLIASLISAVIAVVDKDYTGLVDSGIILLIVILNSVIGTIQEYKADTSMKALAKINKPFIKVIRNGETIKGRRENIVVGDIVVLEAGDIVPADVRLIESHSLKIQESALTGESVPVEKDHDVIIESDAPLGDRKNMAFSSGVVMFGRGRGVVVATGMQTEVGKIAKMLNVEKESVTPLQRELNHTAKILSAVILVIACIIFIVGLLNASAEISWVDRIVDNFMVAVAIAVAAIPEGLTAVVTIVLAIGVKRMSDRKAIVKHLPSVETLGGCEIICSDKTGTLTLNKMVVKQLYCTSVGTFDKLSAKDKTAKMLVEGLALCNDTEKRSNKELVGDPTETSLVAYAESQGIKYKDLKLNNKRVFEIPFDSERKLMTTVHPLGDTNISYTKGAVDMLVKRCTKILDGNKERKITEQDLEIIADNNTKMCSKALRVLALAYKKVKDYDLTNLEQDLVFVGLVGMIDPPRDEVPKAVATCKRAGMTPIMITGDHIDTAIAIAKEIGIYNKGDKAITGAELDKLSDKQFMKQLKKIKVFARVS
ncbi:MAG: HAD-IC family P-type ATPase, partial [Clostridia bacterium]|nr:HAD-IC family P-type ATPase [Clostridia bacterium]